MQQAKNLLAVALATAVVFASGSLAISYFYYQDGRRQAFAEGYTQGRSLGFEAGAAAAKEKYAPVAPEHVARLAEAFCRLNVEAFAPYAQEAYGWSHDYVEEAAKEMRLKYNGWVCEEIQYLGSITYLAGDTSYFFRLRVSGTPMRFIARFSPDGKLMGIY